MAYTGDNWKRTEGWGPLEICSEFRSTTWERETITTNWLVTIGMRKLLLVWDR